MTWRIGAGLAALGCVLALLAYGRHLQVENADLKAGLRRASAALLVAAGDLKARDAALQANGRREAADAGDTAQFWKGQCHAAFSAGLASRRCPGADPGGVRDDLRTLWSAGAFRGDADAERLPGQPGRADRR